MTSFASSDHDAASFLAVAHDFQLGDLVTEARHEKTKPLSRLANEDLPAAVALLKSVDLSALETLRRRSPGVIALGHAIGRTLENGDRVFLAGCGATGRLSLSIETFGRRGQLGAPTGDSLIGFMAGGDAALVRSIESFEDRTEWGGRQLADLGFRDGDLLVGITEGGETPFVIGAVEHALEAGPSNPPFFLYCNPDDILRKVAERSRRLIDDSRVRKINLTVGPMALTGSTRMQASTVQMAAAGWAVARRDDPSRIPEDAAALRNAFAKIDPTPLIPLIERESAVYAAGDYIRYDTDAEHAITVFTDTTERSPTFSLPAFENRTRPHEPLSQIWLCVDGAESSLDAWEMLLARPPRSIEWEDTAPRTGRDSILGFDFSEAGREARRERTGGAAPAVFSVRLLAGGDAAWTFQDASCVWPLAGLSPLHRHLALKMLLNAHSTLVMGRLRRYQDNLMTFVSPSNLKLIDRSIRYARILLGRRKPPRRPSYRIVAEALFDARKNLQPGEPIVLKTVELVESRLTGARA